MNCPTHFLSKNQPYLNVSILMNEHQQATPAPLNLEKPTVLPLEGFTWPVPVICAKEKSEVSWLNRNLNYPMNNRAKDLRWRLSTLSFFFVRYRGFYYINHKPMPTCIYQKSHWNTQRISQTLLALRRSILSFNGNRIVKDTTCVCERKIEESCQQIRKKDDKKEKKNTETQKTAR